MIHSPPLLLGESRMIATRANSEHMRNTGRCFIMRAASSFSRCSGTRADMAPRDGALRAVAKDDTSAGVNALGNRRWRADMTFDQKGQTSAKVDQAESKCTPPLHSRHLSQSYISQRLQQLRRRSHQYTSPSSMSQCLWGYVPDSQHLLTGAYVWSKRYVSSTTNPVLMILGPFSFGWSTQTAKHAYLYFEDSRWVPSASFVEYNESSPHLTLRPTGCHWRLFPLIQYIWLLLSDRHQRQYTENMKSREAKEGAGTPAAVSSGMVPISNSGTSVVLPCHPRHGPCRYVW